jgi:hypothetical protein
LVDAAFVFFLALRRLGPLEGMAVSSTLGFPGSRILGFSGDLLVAPRAMKERVA